MRSALTLIVLAFLFVVPSVAAQSAMRAWWESRDMIHCGGDSRDLITFDGTKSIVKIPGDNQRHSLWHSTQYADYTTDDFVVEFGKVSPWIKWSLVALPYDKNDHPIVLAQGAGAGVCRAPLSKMGIPNYEGADIRLVMQADKEGTVEILRWAVETPHPDPSAAQKAKARKALVNVFPLERGMIPHWNDKIGGFVCAYNQMHQEHYNYWLEDNGELLWGLGNYPEMMDLYGKKLAHYIIKYCKAGAPVRKVVDKPVSANPYLEPGKYNIDTGTLTVVGELKENPYIHLHPSVYESGGLLAAIGDFFVTYKTTQGATETLKFDHPSNYSIDYQVPDKNAVSLNIEASNDRVNGKITWVVLGSRVTGTLYLTNKSNEPISEVISGFRIRDVDRYYKSPINSLKQRGNVALLYSEQPALENCNIIRIVGPVSKSIVFQREGSVIRQADASGLVRKSIGAGERMSSKLAGINAGSTCFADKIDMYFDVDYTDAEISMSYVGTYPLLGLATYSYRYPEDKEARELTNRMMDNFFAARKRLRDRELGYLLWVLNLMGRDKEATVIADQIEEYVAPGQTFDNSQNSSAMAIGLRSVGRWDAADRICAHTITQYSGVNAPTDVLGFGCTFSQAASKDCYKQLSDTLRQMYWDSSDRMTAHSARTVEEGPEEVQAYSLVAEDLLWRNYNGIVPIYLDTMKDARITNMSYDSASGDWRAKLTKCGDFDIFTSFRRPRKVQWDGQDLKERIRSGLGSIDKFARPGAPGWSYDRRTGVIHFTKLSGDGEITIAVDGAPVRTNTDWQPIDYIGLSKRPKS
jgi:hypothetical protein